MGKKAKKKARTPHGEKNDESTLLKPAPGSEIVPIGTNEDVASAVKERKGCVHIEKGVNLVELSEKDWSAGDVACEDCRENAGDRRGSRAKAKAGKKKGHGGESNTDGKAIWVCLQCGHRACGGVGLPTTPQCHAIRHARQARHPVVINYDNPHLRWCFQCSTLILGAKCEESGDILSDAVKIVKNQLVSEVSKDVVNSSPVGESVKTGLGDNSVTSDEDFYVVRGLLNLGNTCFFNSIMQNLLAMDKLRGYFSNIDGSFGPLTITLKKLFTETSLTAGKRGAVNPKSFFGCVCAKAPQFKGYQQQDSHELLRCLLDGLSMEESTARKKIKLMQDSYVSPSSSLSPTFVDVAFGGQVSSTVCCLECGHASTVYEPFLDLSLPVPTRKPPQKTQHVSVVKRAKVPVPPKKGAKILPKPKKDENNDHSTTKEESICESSQEASSVVENTASSIRPDGFDQSHSFVPIGDAANIYPADSAALNYIPSTTPDHGVIELQQDEKDDEMAWLDILGSETNAGEPDIQFEDFDAFGAIDSVCDIDQSIHGTSDVGHTASEAINENTLGSCSNINDDEVPLLVQDCQVILLPYKEESLPDLEVMEGQASSSCTGLEDDASYFDGIGGLFDEPELAIGPSPRPDDCEGNKKDNGTTNSFCSESDPDEVDDTSPVSIETCLTYFIKPELLSKDQGWYCEKCSKVVKPQKRKSEQSLVNCDLTNGSTDLEAVAHVAAQASEECLLSLNQEGHLLNGGSVEHGLTNLLMQIGDVHDHKDETMHMQDSVDSSQANGLSNMDKSTNTLSLPISLNNDSNCANELSAVSTTAEAGNLSSGDVSDNEHEETEDTESSMVKVARDATKRLLIEKAPPILTIHLKRFSQDARGRLSKLNGHVAFGETINLKSYINPRYYTPFLFS